MHAFYLNGGFVQFVALFVDALDKFPNYSRKAVSDELQNGFTQVLFYESMSRLVNRYEYGAPFKQGMQPGMRLFVGRRVLGHVSWTPQDMQDGCSM